MIKKEREIGLLSKEARARSVEAIIAYFQNERGEEIGMIAAEEVLDFIEEKIGPEIYNKAIDDSKKTVAERVESLGVELEILKRT